ncbi:MAG: acetoacetate--CoA ligase [Deltaproteobacteria bacterium]|nr:acetoacetate--CoA ligase [Deltaproteobacteria bacterium]
MTELLWTPSTEGINQANMTRFIEFVNKKHDLALKEYDELYSWSIERIPDFWASVWEFGSIIFSQGFSEVVRDLDKMPGAKWFIGAKLNFAQNLLRYKDDHPALIFNGEGQVSRRMTYAQLYDQVARLAESLRGLGVSAGDRVVGFMPNMIETVTAMLATTSIGAVWSSCSPDFGLQGVLDRFGQIQPKVLFTANGYFYNGRAYDRLEQVAGLLEKIPSLEKVVVVPYTQPDPDIQKLPHAVLFDDFLAPEQGLSIEFEQLPFDHPLYILYSSGTTGVPKCIVHGAGGTLVQHLKELILHTDLKREDKIFYFTTCGWMMWNWLVSSLAAGATLLLYDGSPFFPDPGTLFKWAQDEGMTIFGTSARYLAAVQKEGLKPREKYDLSHLKAILSTGSPLAEESFDFIYQDIKSDLCLSSISGGTDIISCFVLGNPIGPVHRGQIQSRGLGMKVEAYDEAGNSLINEKGELVCTKPFPSMPIYFFNDEGDKKYLASYFETYPHCWYHGDFIEITSQGGVIIHGRSDATLNPGGVRIGTAEIYRQVETLEEVMDSLVVGQPWDNDIRVILFVQLAEGVKLDENLTNKIKTTIRQNASPRHVPAKIIAVADIPYTINGKKVEMAVKNVILDQPVLNRDALANPEALDLYADLKELKD